MRISLIIKELKKIPNNTYLSFFKIGSANNSIEEGSDIDLVFVIDEYVKNTFFDEALKRLMTLKKKDVKLDYTFFRGPIKYSDKKLIHFLVYTKEQLLGENQPVLKSYLKSGKVIKGMKISNLLKGLKFDRLLEDQKHMEDKWKKIMCCNKIRYPEWSKTKNGWALKPKEIRLDSFQKVCWNNYTSKFKTKNL
jgi:hypothetical protein